MTLNKILKLIRKYNNNANILILPTITNGIKQKQAKTKIDTVEVEFKVAYNSLAKSIKQLPNQLKITRNNGFVILLKTLTLIEVVGLM